MKGETKEAILAGIHDIEMNHLAKQTSEEYRRGFEDALCNVETTILSVFGNTDKTRQQENDSVNHPSHYTDGGIETIDFIEAKKLGYHLASVVKYISRAGKKDPDKTIEDLSKAVWYLNRYIGLLQKEEEKLAGATGYTPASPTDDLASALIRSEKGGAI